MKKIKLPIIAATALLFVLSITGFAQTPTYVSAILRNTSIRRIEMTYSINLANITPPSTAFSVMVNSVNRPVTAVAVTGTKVMLYLPTIISYGDNVTVSYTAPVTNQLQSVSGELAANLSAQPVTNNSPSGYIPISDGDNSTYTDIGIGFQVWLRENLKARKYNDGSNIPNITDNATWEGLTSPAYCWFVNDEATYWNTPYGALYNWYVVDASSNGGKNICPVGWHVPSDVEWSALTDYLGGESLAGDQLKEAGTIHWAIGNTGTNTSGFTSLPAGYREPNGSFASINYDGMWWSTTEYNTTNAWYRLMQVDYQNVLRIHSNTKKSGFSIRCLQNVQPLGSIDGTKSVCIGAASPNITFNGIAGTAPFTFTYTVNGGSNQTVTTTSGNSISVSAPTSSAGTFTYSLISVQDVFSADGQTGSATITVTPDNTITLTSALQTDIQTVCINKAITNITYVTTGATGATITDLPAGVTGAWASNSVTISGTPTVSGTFGYAVTLTGGCGIVKVYGIITVTPNSTITLTSAGSTTSQTVCTNTAITNITYDTTGATGATFIGLPPGVTGNFINQSISISGTPTANGTFNYTITLTGGCGIVTATGTITVMPASTITLTSAVSTVSQNVCINTAITPITYTTAGATSVTFSGLPSGVTSVWAADAVTINGTPTASGSFNYTVSLTGGCGMITATGIIVVNPLPTALGSVISQSCSTCNDAAINLAVSGGASPYSFTWTGPDGYNSANQNIASLKPGSYSVVVKDANGCSKTVYSEVINPFIVTNVNNDGIGSLRYAINYANTHNNATADLITFNIPIGLPSTIQPVSALPDVVAPVVLDGFTEPGASLTNLILRVELEGTNAGAGSNGLAIKSNNCTVKGLIIDGFSGNGIQIASGTRNTISANSIFNNDALGIDLGTNSAVSTNDAGDPDTGPNNFQNFPVLGNLSFSPGYVTVTGTLNSLPSALTYKLEFFANKVADNTGYGEGQTYLGSGSVTTNSAGNGTFTVTLPTMTKYGDVITATATDPSGNTSEFSQAIGGLQDQILASINIPFHYQVNGKGVKSIPGIVVVNQVKSAFGNWNGIATSSMSFAYDNVTTPPQYASASDKINLVTFTDDKFPFSPGILAVTAKTLKIGTNDKEAQILDADIVFNPYYVNNSTYDFGIADNPLYSGFFDIQSVTTHEIGHVLGLLHSGVYSATMWFEVGSGITDRSLEQDDKSWISYRYPNKANYNQAFGSISGNIKYGYNNDPVAGAIVLAVDPVTDLAVVHAYSDANGNYLIPGLPPRSYRVYIMPLDGDVYGRDLRPGNISSYIYSNTFYIDYPGEFYNNPDLAVETNPSPTPVAVTAGNETRGIDFLTNKDVTAPTVKSVVPASGASDVSVLPNILITFSEPVDMNTVTDQSCYLTLSGSNTKIGGKYQPDGFEDRSDVVLFTLPENALSYESTYTLHITTGVKDLKTNPLGVEYSSTFSTGVHDVVPPTIKSTIPGNNTTNVFLSDKIMVFFSEPMIKSTVESAFLLTTDNGTVNVNCSTGWDGYTTFTLSPKSPLIEGKTYSLIWTNKATDLSGIGLAAGSITFSTIPVAPPTIVYMEPGSVLKANVSIETAIVVDFSEPINTATVNSSTFKLLLGTSQVSGKFEFLNENSRVVFRPAANLTYGQVYKINLTNGIQDVSQVKQNFAGSATTFTAATKPSKPHIDYNDPASNIGNTIEIGGYGFDPDPSKDKVTFATLTSSVNTLATTATLTGLTVKVPFGAVSGAIRVTSNGVLDDQDSNNPTTYIFIGSFTDPCNTATGNIGTGTKPRDGAVDFNGANAYITNSGENTVSVITNLNTDDPLNNPPYELFPRIQVGTTPMKIDINTTGTRAYVTNFDSHTVSVIDLTNINGKKNQVIETVKVGVNPYGVVANGNKVYVANYGSDNITVINVDPASGGFDHATANINTGTHNRDIDISPDGGTLAVTGDNGLTLVKITKTALGFDYAVSNSNSGTSTRDATISKDGGTAIVTTTEGGIFFVNLSPGDNYGAAYGNINPGSKAGDGKTTFDGLFYYVTNPDDNKVTVYKITYEGSGSGSGTVSSSSRLMLKEYATVPVGDSPEGIAMDPVNDKVVVVNSGSNNVTPVFICCPAVKTPSAYIKDLIFTVENMIYSGDIPKLRGYALIFTLNSSLRNINAGKTKLAIADLKVFIGLVNTYIKNKHVSTANGNALIAAANAIIAKLQGNKSDTTESSVNNDGQSNLPDLISISKLGTIYPNPFSQSITIKYEISNKNESVNKVLLRVYDINGRLVRTLVDQTVQSGLYSIVWDGRYENGGRAPYGTYYLLFRSGNVEEVKVIILIN